MGWLFRRPRSPEEVRREVDEELDFHLERKAGEIARAEGLPPDEARREARRRFGNVEGTREYCAEQAAARERRRTLAGWIDAARQDLAYAVRTLRRSPTYTTVVVGTLALGIAANTVIFSVMNPYLLRELPYRDAGELVQLGQVDPVTGWDAARFSMAMYEDYRERSRAFEAMGAYTYTGMILSGAGTDGNPSSGVNVGLLTANLFDVLGVEATRGRTFAPGEDGAGGARVAVLDHGLWRDRYGGDPGIVGRTIRLDGTPHTVIGIMPPDFIFPWNEVRVWVPSRFDPALEERDATRHMIVGRLADGWSREGARAELEAIQGDLGELHPDADGRYAGVSVRPLREALNFAWEQMALGFPVLLAGVLFVLLIVCVNVANLTLARAGTREEEVAVRAALGAGRRRLVRQLLTESGVLAVGGGALGLLLAYWAVAAVAPHVPDAVYRVGEVSVDGRVLGYAALITLGTPAVFGLLPALGATRGDLASVLRSGGAGSGTGRRKLRGRRALVVAEVALGIMLVTGAGLMIRSFGEVRETDLGFRPERILTVAVNLPRNGYETAEEVRAYYERATAELGSLPGVDGVGAITHLPMNHEMVVRQFAVPGAEPARAADWPLALYARVSPGYFRAMGVPLLAGRPFRDADGAGSDIAIVSASLAERRFGGESPVGRTLTFGDPPDSETLTVVGVAGEVRQGDLVYDAHPQVYRPIRGAGYRRRFLVVATPGDPGALAPLVRERLRAVDPDLPVGVRPFREVLRENTFVWGVGSAVLGAFGVFALLLASLGIYGVMAYSVERRKREMGVRMALGAGAARIRRLIVGEGLRLAGVGLMAGLLLAAGGAHLMSAVLYGVSPLDPVALTGTLVVFAVVAVGSSAVPAIRASRAEPARILREE